MKDFLRFNACQDHLETRCLPRWLSDPGTVLLRNCEKDKQKRQLSKTDRTTTNKPSLWLNYRKGDPWLK